MWYADSLGGSNWNATTPAALEKLFIQLGISLHMGQLTGHGRQPPRSLIAFCFPTSVESVVMGIVPADVGCWETSLLFLFDDGGIYAVAGNTGMFRELETGSGDMAKGILRP